ncbi:MAG: hypothetical protein ABIG44_06390 [Planctomycetota bacterium]
MPTRLPQINFQVVPPLKYLYTEAKLQGHLVSRFCAAGLLMMVEDPVARAHALSRLREWEEEFENASEKQVRSFVEGARDALLRNARGSQPAHKARKPRRKPKRD